MASEATGIKTGMAIQVNMHMDIRVKEVARFKSKVIFIVSLLASLKGHCPLVIKTDLRTLESPSCTSAFPTPSASTGTRPHRVSPCLQGKSSFVKIEDNKLGKSR